MTGFRFSGLISVLFLFFSQEATAQNQQDIQMAEKAIKALNEVLMYDITSPPVASRDYVYSLLAFYEATVASSKEYKTYAGQLKGLSPLPKLSPEVEYDRLICGMTAFYKTAYALVFSKQQFQQLWDTIHLKLQRKKISPQARKRSIQFGEQVAAHILAWAQADGFAITRTLPRFSPGKQEGAWRQTGPDFMEAVEPYWNSIRTMTLSKADEYKLPPPAFYKSEKFLAACKEVYETGLNLTEKQRAIANFWDCNPFATQTAGHLIYSVKKISPAGHWIGITGIAIRNKKQNLAGALYAYSLVSVAMFDGIISCWDEKYRSNYIRPVTAIQQLISPIWQPELQTPPFPEYPSGHSVISNAAATILTHLYGENFHYTDDVEKPYGLPARSFTSFFAAANEAAVSRLYGGIHFREAIENGKEMGKYVGNNVLKKLTVRLDKNRQR